jgi:hypothetical protein
MQKFNSTVAAAIDPNSDPCHGDSPSSRKTLMIKQQRSSKQLISPDVTVVPSHWGRAHRVSASSIRECGLVSLKDASGGN